MRSSCAVARRLAVLLMAIGASALHPQEAPGFLLEIRGAEQVALVDKTQPAIPRVAPLPLAWTLEEAARLDHAWVWGPTCFPTQVPAERLRGFACQPSARSIQISIPIPASPPGSPNPDRGILRAAPPEAWREMPESLIPSWPIDAKGGASIPAPHSGNLRLRWAGRDLASGWLDAGATSARIAVPIEPALPLQFQVVGEGGRQLAPAAASLGLAGPLRDRFLALELDVRNGRLAFAPVPDSLRFAIVFGSPVAIPRRVEGTAEQLPKVIPLASGCAVDGLVVDERGQALASVTIQAEGRVDGGILMEPSATSDTKGRYLLSVLPRTEVALEYFAAGRERKVARLDLSDCSARWNAERVALGPGRELQVRAVDPRGDAIPGAKLSLATGQSVLTDSGGQATLRELAPQRAISIRASAKGFLPSESAFEPPFPEELVIRLAFAGSVSGRIVDRRGSSIPDARVELRFGSSHLNEKADPQGIFDFDVRPDTSLELIVTSATAAALKMPLAPLAAGERRDLGDLVLPQGLSAVGVVIARGERVPVPGATVWALADTPMALLAWARVDTQRTRSSADGSFLLTGLPPEPVAVRVEAAGFAPAQLRLVPNDDGETQSLGVIELSRGGTIEVRGDPELDGTARADWRREWRESDMISAPVMRGEGRLLGVPAGTTIVSVFSQGQVVCEGEVEVEEDSSVLFDCSEASLEVEGAVSMGGRAVGPGTLSWFRPTTAGSLIMNRSSRLGLVEQQVFGAGRQVNVSVDASGRFRTGELAGGLWQLSWALAGSATRHQQEIRLPARGRTAVMLDFPGLTVRGSVVDGDGRPLAGARAVELLSSTNTAADSEGAFELAGLAPGPAEFRAFVDTRQSRLVRRHLDAKTAEEPITLVVDSGSDRPLRIAVTVRGEPAPGAFVYLQSSAGDLRLLTANREGIVQTRDAAVSSSAVRVAACAAGLVGLGAWVDTDSARRRGMALDLDSGGALEVRTEKTAGTLEIEDSSGWPVSRLLRQLGVRFDVSPGQPLLLAQLPPGVYSLAVGAEHRQVAIEAAQTRTIELP